MTRSNSQMMEELFLYQFEQGFLTEVQIQAVTGIGAEKLASLIGEGYIDSRGSYFDDLTLYFPTEKARDFLEVRGIKIYVDWLRRPPIKNELHDRRLTDVRIAFEQMGYPGWQSERCLKQRGMRKVTPDAILEVGRPKLAIELELTGKGQRQYEKKFQFYSGHPSIDAVLYLVAIPEIKQSLIRYVKSCPKIYVVLLRDLMQLRQRAEVEAALTGENFNLQEFLRKVGEIGFHVRQERWKKIIYPRIKRRG